MYYLRARYYDPALGRFTQEDTYRGDYKDPLSLNYYTYCHNNPVRYVDRSGNIPVETIMDLLSFGWSLYDLLNDPSWSNLGFLIWDFGGLLVPYLPGSYAGRGIRAIGNLDNIANFARGSGKLDDIMDVAKYTDEVASSYYLHKNMIAAGIEVPDYEHAAHHIVAGASKYAEEARSILRQFGISINDAVNGVFLPTIKGISDAAYHPGLHTVAYYDKVNELLSAATTREEALSILEDIALQLQNGTFLD